MVREPQNEAPSHGVRVLDEVARRELARLSAQGLRQLTLVAMFTIPLGLLLEWVLRPLGFGAEDRSLTAFRVGVIVLVMGLVHLFVQKRGEEIRHPFLLGTLLMFTIAGVGGTLANATGGFESPYQVAAVPILVLWTMVMPGGYRYAVAPLLGSLLVYLGVIVGWGPEPEYVGEAVATTFFQVASMVVALIVCERLERWRVRVAMASYTDALTGVMSRGYLLDRLEELRAKRRRSPAPVSVLMIDLDHFKKVNDTYGHVAGDAVLCMVADVLKGSTRTEDLCGRMGGEEFMLVLDECDEAQALRVAERIRQQVAASEVYTAGQCLRVTLSAGVAVAPDGQYDDPDTLIRAADAALYRSKGEGRNQVHVGELKRAESVA